MVVKYVAYTWQEQKVEGFLDVDREGQAREMLPPDNLVPYRLSQVRKRRSLVQLMRFQDSKTAWDRCIFPRPVDSKPRPSFPKRESGQ